MPAVSRPCDKLGMAEGPPPLAQIPDLLLLPGDSTAEGAESALHLGAPVAPLYLAGTVLAPGVERSVKTGWQAPRATVSQSVVRRSWNPPGIHLPLASSSCFTPNVVPNSLSLLSLTRSLNKHLQLFAKFPEPQGLGLQGNTDMVSSLRSLDGPAWKSWLCPPLPPPSDLPPRIPSNQPVNPAHSSWDFPQTRLLFPSDTSVPDHLHASPGLQAHPHLINTCEVSDKQTQPQQNLFPGARCYAARLHPHPPLSPVCAHRHPSVTRELCFSALQR